MLAVSNLEIRSLKSNSYLLLVFYFLSLALLLGLLFFGTEVRGVKGWYGFGPVSFDPKFFSVLILILVLAKYFSLRHVEMASFTTIIISGFYVFFPVMLILLEPDLGSSLGFIMVWVGIVIFSGLKLRHFFVIVLASLIIFAGSWQFFFERLPETENSDFYAFAKR